MAYSLFAALAAGTAAMLTPADTLEHSVSVDHHRGGVATRYTGAVGITHKQIGTVSAGGRASTLRCAWRAGLTVEREARHARGVASRTIARENVVAGSRPGWCSTQAAAIRSEVAARQDEMRGHLLAISEADRGDVIADVERAHATDRAG